MGVIKGDARSLDYRIHDVRKVSEVLNGCSFSLHLTLNPKPTNVVGILLTECSTSVLWRRLMSENLRTEPK